MRRFALSANDLDALRKCRRDNCKFKLPGVAMDTARQLLQGTPAQQLALATTFARERLARYVNDYRARGVAALVVYEDRGRVRARDAFDRLLAESPYGAKYSEAVTRHFEAFPADTLPDSHDVVYWISAAPSRLRPTLMLWHRVVDTPPDRPNLTLIAEKQIYADHYLEAALDLSSVLTRSTTPGAESCYLVVLRRYRFDNLPQGILRIHDRAVGRLRDGLTSELERLKAPR